MSHSCSPIVLDTQIGGSEDGSMIEIRKTEDFDRAEFFRLVFAPDVSYAMAAAELGVSKQHIRRLVDEGFLHAERSGRALWIHMKDWKEFVDKHVHVEVTYEPPIAVRKPRSPNSKPTSPKHRTPVVSPRGVP